MKDKEKLYLLQSEFNALLKDVRDLKKSHEKLDDMLVGLFIHTIIISFLIAWAL